jgi:hypothetical protein
MHKRIFLLIVLSSFFISLVFGQGNAGAEASMDWNRKLFSLEAGVLGTLVYTAIGILMLTVAFKMKDLMLPGKLTDQLIKEKNVAVAIVTAAYMLGICIIIAAAISS